MEKIRINDKDSLLKDIRDFFFTFNFVAVQEQEEQFKNFRDAMLRLCNVFDNINEKEKEEKNEKFNGEFKNL